MKSPSRNPAQRLYISRAALADAELPAHLRSRTARANAEKLSFPVAVVCASEILMGTRLPEPVLGPETRYLVLADVAEPALVHLPRILGLHRPDYRLYPTRDAGTVRRLLIGLSRKQPVLGIVDAYPLGKDLYVLTADFELRRFPLQRVPVLAGLGSAELTQFVLDDDGSYLHWPGRDLHLGVSQLLQEVDPAFMADVAIERNERDRIGPALREMREERSLRQSDIPGLGARQVSRVESGVSRLRYGAAQKFAEAFGMQTSTFLDELGQRAAAMRTASGPKRSGRRTGSGTKPASPAA